MRGTRADCAYRSLRRAIVMGELASNDVADEPALMERYELGRTPIREALKRLAMEQFIVWPPRRTPYVRATTLEDLHRLYESRQLMEGPAARLAATRVTDAQIAFVKRKGDLLRDACEAGDVYRAVEADHAFHLAVTAGADNRYLTEAVDRLNCGSLRLWYVAHLRVGMKDTPADHQPIIDALDARDADAIGAALEGHIQRSLERQYIANGSVLGKRAQVPSALI